ncbi:MAG: penicillin acylase family protein [Rhodospirillales bacterium]
MPRRRRADPPDLVTQPAYAWDFPDIAGGAEMPVWADPPDGIVTSANERPDKGDIPLGYFFSPPDRARRLHELLDAPAADASDKRALPQDVLHEGALPVRDELLRLLEAAAGGFRCFPRDMGWALRRPRRAVRWLTSCCLDT